MKTLSKLNSKIDVLEKKLKALYKLRAGKPIYDKGGNVVIIYCKRCGKTALSLTLNLEHATHPVCEDCTVTSII